MEKKIDVYDCIYDVADEIVALSENEITEAVQEAIKEYVDQDMEEMDSDTTVFVSVGELCCDTTVLVEYCQHGKQVGSENVRAYMTVDLGIELNVYQLLVNGEFVGEAQVDYATLETRHDDVELDDDLLGDVDDEMTRALTEGIEWSNFKRD